MSASPFDALTYEEIEKRLTEAIDTVIMLTAEVAEMGRCIQSLPPEAFDEED